MKRVLTVLIATASVASLAACGGGETGTASELKFNLAYGNSTRTMTYLQTDPLELPDGGYITSGNLKPVWRDISANMGIRFTDVTTPAQSAAQMIQTQSSTDFKNANIFGGNGIAEDLMNYGMQGKFVDLTEYLNETDMPNFTKYLNENKDVKDAITAVDGGIYHVPYVSEIGEVARTYNMRTDFVSAVLDYDGSISFNDGVTKSNFNSVDTSTGFKNAQYQPFYSSRPTASTPYSNGSVTVTINKKDATTNVIQMQNALGANASGEDLANTLIDYINDQYVEGNVKYTNPSDLYVGAYAAYDIDELVALFRVMKANESEISLAYGGKSTTINPFFVRQSSYREDILRFATYFDGVRAFGSDSYTSRWVFDDAGQIQYTYNTNEMYGVLEKLSEMFAEGLIHAESLDDSNSGNFRTQLYGSDDNSTNQYGLMSFDWIASSTADSLNDNVEVVLPPVANVNGVWQYYVDNSRTIKPDGWSISTSGSNKAQIAAAIELFDYMFSEEGSKMQNYGMDSLLVEDAVWDSEHFDTPNEYPVFKDWVTDQANLNSDGDLSEFLRDYIGALMPVGFAKEIGFEYQYTSERGFAGLDMIEKSTVNMPTYEGTGKTGTNSNYYTLVPPTFSMGKALQSNVTLYEPQEAFYQLLFNVIMYKTAGGAPSGIEMAYSVTEYQAKFTEKNIKMYIETYQMAYEQMLEAREEE